MARPAARARRGDDRDGGSPPQLARIRVRAPAAARRDADDRRGEDSASSPRWSRSVVPSYSVRNTPRSCSSGTTLVDERVQPAGRDVRDEDEAVAGVGLHEVVDRPRRRSPGEPMKICRPVTSMISSRMRQFFGLGELPPLAGRWPAGRGASARWPGPGRWCSRRRPGRCRAAGRPGRSADRSRFQTCSRSLIAVCAADLLPAHLVRELLRPRRRCRRGRRWRRAG